jgi:tetratricopeptide (TPR) repeat protein
MAKHTDDIYKKESVPQFARRKYRSSSSDTRAPDPMRPGKQGSNSGSGKSAGRGASGMFDAMNAPRRSSGSSGRGKSRGSTRTSGPTKANLIIVAVLVVALLIYGGIFGMVRFGGKFKGKGGGITQNASYTKTLPPSNPPVDPNARPQRHEPKPQRPVMNTASVFEEGIAVFISNVAQARTEINLADSPLNKGTAEETIQLLEAQLQKNPNLITLKRQLGKIHYENGQYLEAAKYFGEILSADPSDVYTRLLLANAFFEGRDYESATAVGHWILADDRFNSDARQILVRSLMKEENFDAAIPHLRLLSEENSLDIAAQNNLGVAYMRLRKYKLASMIFEGTIKIDPSHPVGYFNLAVCYAKWTNDTTLISRLDKPPVGSDMIQNACDVLYAAQAQFGTPFVRQWILTSEFDEIRTTAPFERLKDKFSVNDGTVNNSITLEPLPREETFGKAILPKEVNN